MLIAIRNLQMLAMPSLMTWRWSSWVSCAPEASLILGEVKVQMDEMNKDHSLPLARPNHTAYLLFTVFQEFVRFSNKDIEQIIKKEMSGDVKNAFFAIGKHHYSLLARMHFTSVGCQSWHCSWSLWFAVRSVKNQPSYFADRLYKAMKVLCHAFHAIHLSLSSAFIHCF